MHDQYINIQHSDDPTSGLTILYGVNKHWNLPWNGASPLADQTSTIIAELERSECEELCLLLNAMHLLAKLACCKLSLLTLCYHWQILSNSLFLFSFSEYGVRGRKTDNKAKMKGGLDWIRGLRARSPYNGTIFLVNVQ